MNLFPMCRICLTRKPVIRVIMMNYTSILSINFYIMIRTLSVGGGVVDLANSLGSTKNNLTIDGKNS